MENIEPERGSFLSPPDVDTDKWVDRRIDK